ncbi:MAG: DUF3316 domain-containing protein [Alloprevotella sp.]|nr:DUF3316 domain-containing protein [Alloprevotella sp.]
MEKIATLAAAFLCILAVHAHEGDTISAPAPPCTAAPEAHAALLPDWTEHRWLFGVWGRQNILDTYLSPLEYTGTTHGTLHRSERPAHWGRGVSTVMQMGTTFAYDHSPTDDSKALDLQLAIGGGFTRSWRPATGLRIAAGGLLQGSGGFTYNISNGNNPVQARLALELVPTTLCEYDFRLLRHALRARIQMDLPLAGMMFSPRYGQSYYEIFGLGQRDRNIRLTTPFSAPSARLLATMDIPVGNATLTVGYHADVRQSKVNALKRHAWNNTIVLGFVRHVRRVKAKEARTARKHSASESGLNATQP